MKRQLHLVLSAATNSGGEGLAALRYAESLARAGGHITLLSKQISATSPNKTYDQGSFSQYVAPTRTNIIQELFAQYRFVKNYCLQEKVELIHLHGMWSLFLAIAALFAYRNGVALVISPHGCLEPWALGYSYKKKRFALKVYQGAILRAASLFVATAEQELRSIRQLGLSQPVATIPNGVDIRPAPSRGGTNRTVKTILFLSRIHPIKGLLDLVEAWAIVRQPGWRILIAGGDEDGYRAKVEALIQEKKLVSDFEFVGFVHGERKQICFNEADVFILPTYSENFGIAVAEALANELPVITTTGAPWRELLTHRCGWWVEPGVEGVSNGLREAISCNPNELKEMGKRGRQLVINNYSWEKIGCDALQVSQWLQDTSRPKPSNVDVVGN